MKAVLSLPAGGEVVLCDGLRIGRGEENELCFDDVTVSRRHARICQQGPQWCVEDCGSLNGTFVNGVRVPPGFPHPLRHGDRLGLGETTLVVLAPDMADDPCRTLVPGAVTVPPPLSTFQLQVVRCLCEPWLTGSEELPSNAEIAADLGTPEASEAVKAALKRVYEKAGLTDGPVHVKRHRLCRIARENGWI